MPLWVWVGLGWVGLFGLIEFDLIRFGGVCLVLCYTLLLYCHAANLSIYPDACGPSALFACSLDEQRRKHEHSPQLAVLGTSRTTSSIMTSIRT